MNYFLGIICSVFYLLVVGVILLRIFRRSKFWPVFLSIEYFYILGIGVFPLLLFMGIVEIPSQYERYHGSVENISPIALIHVFSYALGAFIGFFSLNRFSSAGALALIGKSKRVDIDPLRFFYFLVVFSIAGACLFFWAVGFERALTNASASRGGDFSEFDGLEGFLFLKRFAIIGLYAIAAFPFVFAQNKRVKSSFFLFFVVGVLGYITTVSRFALFETFVTPLLIYFAYGKSKASVWRWVALILLFIFSFFVFLFGKEFVGAISSALFSGSSIELSAVSQSAGILDPFSHLFFSVDAGVKSFFANGPFIAKDVFLSGFGIFPSGVLSSLGLESLSYQLVTDSSRFSCVNTGNIVGRDVECIIPPYYTGVSAYVFPLIGGFLFGLFRFYLYSVMHRVWILLSGNERYLVFPYLVLLVFQQIMLFIPATVSLSLFFLIIFVAYNFVNNFLRRVRI